MALPAFTLSYDYRCPFAKNIHLHVISALRAGAEFDVTFAPWTMSQGHRASGSPDVWDDSSKDSELLSLAYSTSIRDQQADHFLDAHEALFLGRHERGIRLISHEEISDVLSRTGVDVESARADVESRRPHEVIGETFRQFERLQAFGVPTFVVDGGATFVRYMKPPTEDAANSIVIISSLVTLMAESPDLNEFKHTQLPN
jgi:protein-disulfide isomerase-like protein with CxxC motif